MAFNLNALIEKAFLKGPAHDANELIFDAREQMIAEHGQGINYEVVLNHRGFDYFQEVVAPRFALYLKSKRYGVAHCPSAFLSLFVEETLYIIKAADFYRWMQRQAQWNDETFAALSKTWEETGRAPAALEGSN